jgi:hypothetical protein
MIIMCKCLNSHKSIWFRGTPSFKPANIVHALTECLFHLEYRIPCSYICWWFADALLKLCCRWWLLFW